MAKRPKRTPITAAIARIDRHADDTLRVERDAVTAVVGPLRRDIDQVASWLAREWVADHGDLTTETGRGDVTVARLQARLDRVPVDVTRPLNGVAGRALAHGVEQGAAEAGARVPAVRAELGPQTRDMIRGADPAARRKLDHAARTLGQLDIRTHQDAMSGLSIAYQAATAAEMTTEWAVNGAVASGVTAVADHLGHALLWVAERDACVVCLALSGAVTDPGGEFPSTATFGAAPMRVWPGPRLDGPPRHPRCRCRVSPWRGAEPGHPEHDLPATLKREARRSVVKGWALDSEPDRVRRDAAARLLARGAELPKSVEARARHRVSKARRFKTPVPDGTG